MPISASFPFFPSDYQGDPHTIVMTTEENGAYCLLMWVCWELEGLPNDMDELAGYARLPVKKFQPMWEKRIKRCFVFDTKRNQFMHPRFEKIIKDIKDFRKQKSKAGKVSGQKRRERKRLDSEQVLDSVGTNDEQNANKSEPSFSSSSSSSSSSSKDVSNDTSEERDALENAWIDSPAILAFRTAFPQAQLSIPQQERIITRATDLLAWRDALAFWVDNDYRERSAGKILDKHDEIIRERTNGTNKKSGKRTDADVFAESADFYANYPES